MIDRYELLSECDVTDFNNFFGEFGITIGHDLLGSPVLYIDTIKFRMFINGKGRAVRHKNHPFYARKSVARRTDRNER
jgi:hypothetical protein